MFNNYTPLLSTHERCELAVPLSLRLELLLDSKLCLCLKIALSKKQFMLSTLGEWE